MPTIPSIRTSIENKEILVLDEHAKNGIFKKNASGRLIAHAGGFSVVYPYEVANGEKWAFRCWHTDVSNTQKRYEIISEAIKNAHLDFLCEFIYVEKGINVEGKIYPTTRMRWVDGITIKDYICQNRTSKERLQALADNFLKMTHALHSQSLAHGDLQHGNILVDAIHQLYLVDYDSFYCPKLQGEPDNVTGLPDYQHPARSRNKSVSEKQDYFSELIIYLSIRAIAEASSLIDKYKVDGADRLLFTKEDYEDITHSEIYKDVAALGKEFKELLDILCEYLRKNDINDLQPFTELLVANKIHFTTSTEKAIRNQQEVVLNWVVPFDAIVTLLNTNSNFSQICELKGCYSTILADDAEFMLSVETKTGQVIRKSLSIRVFDECTIEFKADKHYIYPTIPVTLSWEVANAKSVMLNSEPVEALGTKVIEPEKATTYVLSAEDEFGIKEKKIDIQMLPLPQVKSLLVPTPNITSNLSVHIKQPKYQVDVRFPTINIDWINVEIPKVPSLEDLGISTEFSPPVPKINLMSSIRKVFNHIKNSNER